MQLKLYLVEFTGAHPADNEEPAVVVRSIKEPTEQECIDAINSPMGTIYIDSIKPTTEKAIRYKGYRILGVKNET